MVSKLNLPMAFKTWNIARKKKKTFNWSTMTYQSNFWCTDPASKLEELVDNLLQCSVVQDIENRQRRKTDILFPCHLFILSYIFITNWLFTAVVLELAWMATSLLTVWCSTKTEKGLGGAMENNTLPAASLRMTGFGGGSVMVWGGISLEGCTNLFRSDNGTQATIRHHGKIPEPIVRTCTGAVGPGFRRWATMAALKWIDHAVSGPHVHQNHLKPAELNLWCYTTPVGLNVDKYHVPLI